MMITPKLPPVPCHAQATIDWAVEVFGTASDYRAEEIRCGRSLVDTAFADHPLRGHRLFEKGILRKLESNVEKTAHVPGTIIAAGILWILFASLHTLSMLCGQSAALGRDIGVVAAASMLRSILEGFLCAGAHAQGFSKIA
jgi:hypothetical protein